MCQHFHPPVKIEFAMELKRKKRRAISSRSPEERALLEMFQMERKMERKMKRSASPPSPRSPKRRATLEMFQRFHRPAKIKFAMELKRKRSASPKESPLGLLFNDVGVKALMGEIKEEASVVRIGKNFLASIQGHLNNNNCNNSGAKDIYGRARLLWKRNRGKLFSACTYAIDEEPSFSDTLLAYANQNAPELRMASMMKDPWLDFILGIKQYDRAFIIRGFLSVLIAYWNMRDLLDKYDVSDYGPKRVYPTCVPSRSEFIHIEYAIDHILDFVNLKEVVDSQFGSECDPHLLGRLFEQICDFQKNGMELDKLWKSGERSMVRVVLRSVDSGPFVLGRSFSFWDGHVPWED